MNTWTKGIINLVGDKTPHIVSSIPLQGDMADLYHTTDDDEYFVKENAKANGQRLVDCWNACLDIEDPQTYIPKIERENKYKNKVIIGLCVLLAVNSLISLMAITIL